jgi:hypothetical protein
MKKQKKNVEVSAKFVPTKEETSNYSVSLYLKEYHNVKFVSVLYY